MHWAMGTPLSQRQKNHLFSHLNIYHDLKTIETLNCPYQNCLRIFNNIDTYKRHLKQHDLNSKSTKDIPNKNFQSVNSYLFEQTINYVPSSDNDTNLSLSTIDDNKQNHNFSKSDDLKNL
jgi:hypothetical protein